MEGHATEASIDRFLTGKLRKSVMLDELFATYLPQFIAGKEKARFKLKNCLIDSASFIEGDENVHAYFYFNPVADPNFELRIEFKNGHVVAKGDGKWGNMGELIDIDEELKAWIANLYSIGIIKESKKIIVAPKDDGSRVELPVKKHDKEWREAHRKMNATPRKIVEDMFNIANRIATGIFNWQGKQVEPWNPSELSKGRPAVAPPTPTPLSPIPPLTVTPQRAQISKPSAASTLPPLPPLPSGESTLPREPLRYIESRPAESRPPLEPQTLEPPQPQGPAEGASVICPTCGVENPPGSNTCKRCLSPIEY
nr:zinc ribbon domain-containing protein [Candidatus Njordarchaeota archaeon]